MRKKVLALISKTQTDFCNALSEVDGKPFITDEWTRDGGGGGKTCVLQDGNVIEKGGVNISEVYGELTEAMAHSLHIPLAEVPVKQFYATGVSCVIHPFNPFAPTFHFNYRYFELGDAHKPSSWWFGGGCDLTPYYLFQEDAIHFHQTQKDACDRFDPQLYAELKAAADSYFYIKHRQEHRGIGGTFFMKSNHLEPEQHLTMHQAFCEALIPSYIPLLKKRKDLPFTEQNKRWQLIRRGRYVEYNLIYDVGTTFGLKSHGRTESILMSLPKHVIWEYDFHPEAGSPEEQMLSVNQKPRDWV